MVIPLCRYICKAFDTTINDQDCYTEPEFWIATWQDGLGERCHLELQSGLKLNHALCGNQIWVIVQIDTDRRPMIGVEPRQLDRTATVIGFIWRTWIVGRIAVTTMYCKIPSHGRYLLGMQLLHVCVVCTMLYSRSQDIPVSSCAKLI